ncbi:MULTISPECIES: TetR/AcrR family transcriptional regulator [Rhodococcus]|uniref:TetR/AcrR family transcriptional regulator n=1 Tax=Rhodococcus oxybenzonivorans TaxID=1990687 RepID=A0AAE4UXA1_9NOCA|nr:MULTISPECIES: TetR/AcrR family transcriptional regulator [Rhodococcus]MDV7241672.1 TetR/AcrR family transcriptional regulator [Rhodococcus oxybenzonivorans]MDV7264718.1 TetR/AcrR family transcriptional regulator [Rhodococcus oxybenzonivorans]MDV7273795.1 TetR/AcrR family transcriptional regulator [Rhodococcus oxybenzonivorans]MDV7333953.1 TetR/AcrR family transcriptional regulator [Rhodococcus oxybenzonivorans]MDV7343372.1 TetR/AcrR family transcriptional regulator [Rhodococcus oxybenzonivo
MSRLTRQQSHARTREQLLATAERMFLSNGYNATSLEAVAAEAGYSKGAVYSNFATKYDLGLEVLDRVRFARAASLAEAVSAGGGLDERIAAFESWAQKYIGDEGWTVLEVEFATASRTIDGVRTELTSRRRDVTAALAQVIDRQADELGVRLTPSGEALAVRLLAVGIGLGVQRAYDPELPVSALVDVVREAVSQT